LEKWNNWIWQLQNRIESLSDFEKNISLGAPEKAGFEENNFKISCTPYYAELAKSAPVLQSSPKRQTGSWN
jgi:L-lysine 2,3-aminomutase